MSTDLLVRACKEKSTPIGYNAFALRLGCGTNTICPEDWLPTCALNRSGSDSDSTVELRCGELGSGPRLRLPAEVELT